MPESSKVNIKEQDNSASVTPAQLGFVGFEGITRRGPVLRPDIKINSLLDFRKIYGGIIGTTEFPQQCEKFIKAGGKLRVNGIRHFTTITDKTTLTALVAAPAAPIKDSSDAQNIINLFNAVSKFPGADYNDLDIIISAASNGKADYFNLTLTIPTDAEYATEVYKNLKVTKTTVVNSHYLDEINQNSNLAVLGYLDLSGVGVANPRPTNGTFNFVGGSNGGAVLATDYIGDQGAKTGLFAFDAFDDISDIATPNMSDANINIALADYANTRKDLQALIHLPIGTHTSAGLVVARGAYDTPYAAVFAGGISKVDPNTGVETQYSEIADVAIINKRVDKENYPWTSRANFVRGFINDASGVVNNFGSPGSENDLELLAGNQINMIVNANGKIYLKGNFTALLDGTKKTAFFNIVRGLIYVKKSLRPTLEKYLEEPADIPTFIKLYKEVQPFLKSLTDGRFLYKGAGISKQGFDWNGDQDATDINNLKYNTKEDLNKGIYNVGLDLYPINSIQVINLGITINAITNTISFTL